MPSHASDASRRAKGPSDLLPIQPPHTKSSLQVPSSMIMTALAPACSVHETNDRLVSNTTHVELSCPRYRVPPPTTNMCPNTCTQKLAHVPLVHVAPLSRTAPLHAPR